MPDSAILRAYPDVERTPFVPRDRYLPDRWTGALDLQLSIDRKHPLVIGAGWLDLQDRESRAAEDSPGRDALLVAEIVRRGPEGVPVIPGSSLKGAVRQVFELLTASCEPGVKEGNRGTCKSRAKIPRPEVCPACSFFGGMSLAGRIAFGEGSPEVPDAVETAIRRVPTPWPPQQEIPGTIGVYDQSKAHEKAGAPREEVEATWAAYGTFRTRLRVTNADDEELGLLFASLGIGWDGPGPSLRLGGKKFHGFGSVDVALLRATRVRPGRQVLEGDEPLRWAVDLREAALAQGQRRPVWELLHRSLHRTET